MTCPTTWECCAPGSTGCSTGFRGRRCGWSRRWRTCRSTRSAGGWPVRCSATAARVTRRSTWCSRRAWSTPCCARTTRRSTGCTTWCGRSCGAGSGRSRDADRAGAARGADELVAVATWGLARDGSALTHLPNRFIPAPSTTGRRGLGPGCRAAAAAVPAAAGCCAPTPRCSSRCASRLAPVRPDLAWRLVADCALGHDARSDLERWLRAERVVTRRPHRGRRRQPARRGLPDAVPRVAAAGPALGVTGGA